MLINYISYYHPSYIYLLVWNVPSSSSYILCFPTVGKISWQFMYLTLWSLVKRLLVLTCTDRMRGLSAPSHEDNGWQKTSTCVFSWKCSEIHLKSEWLSKWRLVPGEVVVWSVVSGCGTLRCLGSSSNLQVLLVPAAERCAALQWIWTGHLNLEQFYSNMRIDKNVTIWHV